MTTACPGCGRSAANMDYCDTCWEDYEDLLREVFAPAPGDLDWRRGVDAPPAPVGDLARVPREIYPALAGNLATGVPGARETTLPVGEIIAWRVDASTQDAPAVVTTGPFCCDPCAHGEHGLPGGPLVHVCACPCHGRSHLGDGWGAQDAIDRRERATRGQ